MDQRVWRGRIVSALLACAVLAGASAGVVADVDPVEVLQVVESFRRLAMLEPAIAGGVWMDDTTRSEWRGLVESLTESAIGSSVWLIDAQAFAGTSTNGTPMGGLYSPWIGVLLVLELDETAATIVGFSLEPVDDPIEIALDPFDLALDLMDSIERGAAMFEKVVGAHGEATSADERRSTFAARVAAYDDVVSPAFDPAAMGSGIERVLDRILAGIYDGPLSLLEGEDVGWIASLTPVWVGDVEVVVLGSPAEPLNLVWLELRDGAADVLSVSLIQLFDRVTTRGGEES